MRETRSSGSVEGVVGNHDPYSDFCGEASSRSRRAFQNCSYSGSTAPHRPGAPGTIQACCCDPGECVGQARLAQAPSHACKTRWRHRKGLGNIGFSNSQTIQLHRAACVEMCRASWQAPSWPQLGAVRRSHKHTDSPLVADGISSFQATADEGEVVGDGEKCVGLISAGSEAFLLDSCLAASVPLVRPKPLSVHKML
jgi:hypothetical protein